MTARIEPFSAAHGRAALAFWKTCRGVGLGAGDTPSELAAFLRRNPGMSFVAMGDGRIVGTILGGHDGRRGTLYHLAVDPALRRRGLGRRLVDRSLRALRAAGIKRCYLFVLRDNDGGLAFWRRLGWRERTDLVTMSRPMTEPKRAT